MTQLRPFIMTPVQPLPPVLTVVEAAKLLRAHPNAVRRYIATHQLMAVRIGRYLRIRSEDLLEFIATRPLTVRTSKKHFIQCRQGAIRTASQEESARG